MKKLIFTTIIVALFNNSATSTPCENLFIFRDQGLNFHVVELPRVACLDFDHLRNFLDPQPSSRCGSCQNNGYMYCRCNDSLESLIYEMTTKPLYSLFNPNLFAQTFQHLTQEYTNDFTPHDLEDYDINHNDPAEQERKQIRTSIKDAAERLCEGQRHHSSNGKLLFITPEKTSLRPIYFISKEFFNNLLSNLRINPTEAYEIFVNALELIQTLIHNALQTHYPNQDARYNSILDRIAKFKILLHHNTLHNLKHLNSQFPKHPYKESLFDAIDEKAGGTYFEAKNNNLYIDLERTLKSSPLDVSSLTNLINHHYDQNTQTFFFHGQESLDTPTPPRLAAFHDSLKKIMSPATTNSLDISVESTQPNKFSFVSSCNIQPLIELYSHLNAQDQVKHVPGLIDRGFEYYLNEPISPTDPHLKDRMAFSFNDLVCINLAQLENFFRKHSQSNPQLLKEIAATLEELLQSGQNKHFAFIHGEYDTISKEDAPEQLRSFFDRILAHTRCIPSSFFKKCNEKIYIDPGYTQTSPPYGHGIGIIISYSDNISFIPKSILPDRFENNPPNFIVAIQNAILIIKKDYGDDYYPGHKLFCTNPKELKIYDNINHEIRSRNYYY